MIAFNDRPYIFDALRYTSNRRRLFIDTFATLRQTLGFDPIPHAKVSRIIELLHSSASIIDDVQDNESSRKDLPSYYQRHGYATAAFAALRLWHEGIKLIDRDYPLTDFEEHFERLLTAQEADTGLLPIPDGVPSLSWYFDVSSRKISEELIILFKLCNPNFRELRESADLIAIIEMMGKLIQYQDDRIDVVINSSLVHQSPPYVFTLSFPYALLIQKDQAYSEYVGKPTSKELAEKIDSELRTKVIEYEIDCCIEKTLIETKQMIDCLKTGLREPVVTTLSLLSREYWEDEKPKYVTATRR